MGNASIVMLFKAEARTASVLMRHCLLIRGLIAVSNSPDSLDMNRRGSGVLYTAAGGGRWYE